MTKSINFKIMPHLEKHPRRLQYFSVRALIWPIYCIVNNWCVITSKGKKAKDREMKLTKLLI